MMHVQVYHEKQQEYYLVPFDTNDSFQLLKEKLYNKLEGLVEDEEKSFSIFTMEMASPFAKQIKRRNYTPFDSDIVFDVVQRVEKIYSGYITLKLVDARGDGDHWSGESISGSELLQISTADKHERFGDSESCTVWANTGYNSIGGGVLGVEHGNSGSLSPGAAGTSDALHAVPRLFCSPTLLDSLFTELSGMAVIQGRLSKKITSHRKQDIWREQYFILDGRMGRLWFFPIAADLSASGGNNIASNVNHNRELGASGLGVPSFIPLLCGTNTRAQDAVTVSSHRSDQTAFTITISETYSVAAGGAVAPLSAFNSRAVTLRAPTAEKAARWVQRLSSLHGMLHQPLLPPGPDNPRLYDQVASKFVQEYAQGKTTYTAAALNTLTSHEPHAAHSHNHAPPTLSECGGGGGEGAPPVPATARCSSHWASNSMMESLEECVSATQQGNTARDGDHLDALMTFEGMLKSKYLRGYFQKYLMNNCTEETLLFWEYAEDYWRAHPFSPHPFVPSPSSSFPSSSSGSGLGASARINAAYDALHLLREHDSAVLTSPAAVRQWAESLYLTFIHYNAPYQIGCCTGKDMLRVGAAIDQLADGDMPPYNLFRSIQLSTFNFMKTMCYPDFIAQHNYHRILVAALHAGDRAAMNVHVLATHVASEREPSTFDGFHHINSSPNVPAAPFPAAGASPATTSRGFLGLMRNIVGGKAKDAHSAGTGTVHESDGARGGGGLGADVQSYPARWRIVKLVAFELVRGDPGILTTTGGTAASADSVATGSAKYKIGRRKDSRRSIVGDKLKKILALQNGVYKKISWLPEWWWDLVPAINPLEEAPGQQVWDMSTLSDVGDLLEEEGSSVGVWTGSSAGEEESFLDETCGSEQLSDPPAAAAAPLNSWTYDAECGTNWMPTDSNHMKGVFERTRRTLETTREAHSDRASLHVRLLLQKQWAEEDDQGAADPHARRSSAPNLFLPPGWKPNAVNNPINGAKVAQLLEAPQVSPSMMTYSSSMPACVSELNLSMGRALLEDYAHLQPSGYHMQVAQAGTGALVMCSVVRCRYLRPSLKQQPANMLIRGFRNSVAVGASLHAHQATDRRSVESSDGHGHNTPPRTNSGPNPRRTVLGSNSVLHRSESMCISSAPLPVLSAQHVAYTKTALVHQPNRRSDEFTAAANTNTIAEWPRQCAALYLCLGVPRLYLIDPSSLVPSALIDLHSVRRIAPSEQCLHSIDVQDQTSCVWQISPEGIDADDTREGSRRWINTLAALCLPSSSIVHIIKSGYLQKRGRVNKAFKLRWFVLCSDLRLHYYKDDQHGVLKGTIELTSDFGSPKLERHSAGEQQKQVVRFDKELVVTMQATKRMYTLMAEDALQAEDWMNILNDLLSSPVQPGAGTHGPVSPLRSHHAGELDEEEEEDDDEE